MHNATTHVYPSLLEEYDISRDEYLILEGVRSKRSHDELSSMHSLSIADIDKIIKKLIIKNLLFKDEDDNYNTSTDWINKLTNAMVNHKDIIDDFSWAMIDKKTKVYNMKISANGKSVLFYMHEDIAKELGIKKGTLINVGFNKEEKRIALRVDDKVGYKTQIQYNASQGNIMVVSLSFGKYPFKKDVIEFYDMEKITIHKNEKIVVIQV